MDAGDTARRRWGSWGRHCGGNCLIAAAPQPAKVSERARGTLLVMESPPRLGRIAPPRAATGVLLLADIGGYTSFLRAVEQAHQDDAFADGAVPPAYSLVSSLLDGIVDSVVPPFTFSKLEGDAVFAWAAEGPNLPRGADLLAILERCHDAFETTLAGVNEIWPCRCDACARVEALELKFVVHGGAFVVQSIAGGQELVGPEVVMAHRLLKTSARSVIGHGAYALLTAAAADRYDVPTDGAVPLIETYEHYAPVQLHVFPFVEPDHR